MSATTTSATTASSSAGCCTCRCDGTRKPLHAVVVHFGLAHRSRVRQVQRLADFIAAAVPADEMLVVAGDFNDWGEKLDAPMRELGLQRAQSPHGRAAQRLTFPVAGAGVRDGPHLHARAGLPLHLGAARHGLGAHVGPSAAAGRAGAGLAPCPRPTPQTGPTAAMSTRSQRRSLAAVGLARAAGCRVRGRQPRAPAARR